MYEGPWVDVTDNALDGRFPDGGRIYIYGVRRKAWDSRSHRTVPFPRDLVEFVAASPYVSVKRTRTVRFGDVSAKSVDFEVVGGDPVARERSLCGEYTLRDMECLPITADPNDEGYVSFMLLEMRKPLRLIDLRTENGRLMLLAADVNRFEKFAAAEHILATLRLG